MGGGGAPSSGTRNDRNIRRKYAQHRHEPFPLYLGLSKIEKVLPRQTARTGGKVLVARPSTRVVPGFGKLCLEVFGAVRRSGLRLWGGAHTSRNALLEAHAGVPKRGAPQERCASSAVLRHVSHFSMGDQRATPVSCIDLGGHSERYVRFRSLLCRNMLRSRWVRVAFVPFSFLEGL